MDDDGVRRTRGDETIEGVRWAEIARVEIRTLPTGPLQDDVLWVLIALDGTGAVVPSEHAPNGFLERLQELRGFDNEAVIAAMGSTEDAAFTCWTRIDGE